MQRHLIRLGVSAVTFILGIVFAAAPSLFRTSPAPRGASEREVLRANQAYLDAHMNRDLAALDAILADDFTVAGRYGVLTGKARRLALVADSDVTFVSIDCYNTRVWAADDAGEVSGQATVLSRYRGEEYVSPPYSFIRRFERRDGRWQVVSVSFAPAR